MLVSMTRFEQKDCKHTSLNFWLKHYGFRFDIIWFVLTTYALLLIIYKKTFLNHYVYRIQKRN